MEMRVPSVSGMGGSMPGRATFRIAVIALVTLAGSPAYAQLFLTAGASIHLGASRYETVTNGGVQEGTRLGPSGLGLLGNLEYVYEFSLCQQ